MKIIGVTGTNGKTTCVHLICNLLKDQISCASFGTLGIKYYNNNTCQVTETKLTTLGYPELHANLQRVTKLGCEVAAMEVSSHGLAQNRVKDVLFDVAVFTNLSQDHLDYHKTMEAYFAAKLKLFTEFGKYLQKIIINLDDPYGLKLLAHLAKQATNPNLTIIGFSVFPRAKQTKIHDLVYKNINLELLTCEKLNFTVDGITVQLASPWGNFDFAVNLLGIHNVRNLLASMAACTIVMPFAELGSRCDKLEQIPGRLQKVTNKHNAIIFIDYSHTPDGLANGLLAIKQHYPQQKICCVFGCGGDRDRLKRPQMLRVASKYCHNIIVTQDNPRTEDPDQIIADIMSYQVNGVAGKVTIEQDRQKAIELAINYYLDHIILIAGKGHETQQIIGDKAYPFSDYLVAEAALVNL